MKKSFLMLGVAVAALASCSNEEVVDMPQSRAIQFETFVNHSTRSSVTETTEENLNKFFVFGNYGEGTWTPSNAGPYMTLADLTASGATASPGTAWTTGSHIVLGDGTRAHWSSTAWIAGDAP